MKAIIENTDPKVIDWSKVNLPISQVDKLGVYWLLNKIFGKRKKVVVPENMPGIEFIPKYVFQEYHNVPNGNYSKSLTAGYIKGFDVSMLGGVEPVRKELASFFKGMESALDVGCAGGRMANVLTEVGVKDVWGLDPSPYLLQHASKAYPHIKFIQGIAEATQFSNERFDGISACFLFHELPPKAADKALSEFHRILKPGGVIAISEPSAIQMKESTIDLLKNWGIKGVYFGFFAHWMYEPFVKLWHRRNVKEWLTLNGFKLVVDEDSVPIRKIVARKIG